MKKYRIVPLPSSVEYGDAEFEFGKIALEGEGFEERYLTRMLLPEAEFVRPEEADEKTLVVSRHRNGALPDEGCEIRIKGGRVDIACGAKGLLYAYVTLAQILEQADGKVRDVFVKDSPLCKYRGMMLDAARYFIPVDDVRRMADLCVLHKLNAIHLHLTDDQGWRLESDAYPKLHRKGSRRSHTNFDRKPHEGYYTKAEMRGILQYCAERNIAVMPEIDMPGPMRAALACYPELGCFGRQLPVATHSGVKHDILCAGKESTFDFVFRVLDEVAELFEATPNISTSAATRRPRCVGTSAPTAASACSKRDLPTANGFKDGS